MTPRAERPRRIHGQVRPLPRPQCDRYHTATPAGCYDSCSGYGPPTARPTVNAVPCCENLHDYGNQKQIQRHPHKAQRPDLRQPARSTPMAISTRPATPRAHQQPQETSPLPAPSRREAARRQHPPAHRLRRRLCLRPPRRPADRRRRQRRKDTGLQAQAPPHVAHTSDNHPRNRDSDR